MRKYKVSCEDAIQILENTERAKYIVCGLKPFYYFIFPELIPDGNVVGWFDNDVIINMDGFDPIENIIHKFRGTNGQFSITSDPNSIFRNAKNMNDKLSEWIIKNKNKKVSWGFDEKYFSCNIDVKTLKWKYAKRWMDKNFTKNKYINEITVTINDEYNYYLFDHTLKGAHNYKVIDEYNIRLDKKDD